MAFLGWSLSPSYEVALYTCLLLFLWFLIRLVASTMNNLITFFREGSITVDPYLNNVVYPCSYWSEKCKRPYQEDRFHMTKAQKHDTSLYGVFDGHGGTRAAQHCKEHMLQAISSDSEWDQDPLQSFVRNFVSVDQAFSTLARSNTNWNDGSTAIVAAINKNKIFVANAGDCRAIIVQSRGTVVAMSHDHRPDRKDEEARIRRLGGKLEYWGRWRVQGVLAVSRAIGDVSLQPFVTSQPEVMTKSIDAQDEYLVIASDGLWDVMENEDVAKFMVQHAGSSDFLSLGKLLVQEAIRRGTTDNVTALVIDIKKRVASKNSTSTPSTTTPAAGTIGSVDNSLGSSSSHDSDDASDSMPRNSEFFEEVKDLSEDDN